MIDSEIQGVNKMLENIRKRGERYGFNAKEQGTSSSDAISDTWRNPRMHPLSLRKSRLWALSARLFQLLEAETRFLKPNL